MINKIIFINDEHKNFYIEKMKDITDDCYHRALVYLFWLTSETRILQEFS